MKDKLITELSDGELQRVFLARTFVQNPSIILMDETTNHLDLNSQIELIDSLKEWVFNGSRCIIAVLHDINAALNLSDKLLVLKNGSSQYFGSID
ncbi:ATP-binding cassette domain-containing protein, partial [Staphylococcus pseudintermedius]|uniref:ATP-binding cassette domain-containing protein n=1 Tax=Staphylococcus pseudintermedius TaxID=283734 RepID=UPI001F4DE44F